NGLAEPVERRGHVAPADQALAFLGDELLELAADELARFVALRQEAHRHRVVARGRKRQALAFGPAAIERIGYLQQDAGAVTEQRIRADRPAVIEVGEYLQRLTDDRVRFDASDMGNETHTAGIVFVARIVEALEGGILGQTRRSCFPVGTRCAPSSL